MLLLRLLIKKLLIRFCFETSKSNDSQTLKFGLPDFGTEIIIKPQLLTIN